MKKFSLDQIISHDGDSWRVVGIGVTDELGRVYLHLVSTTRFRQQINGKNPVQIGDWIFPPLDAEGLALVNEIVGV